MIKKFVFLLTLFYCSVTPSYSATQPPSKHNTISKRSKRLRVSSRPKEQKRSKQEDNYEEEYDIKNNKETNWLNYITYPAILILVVFMALQVKNFFLPSIEFTQVEEYLEIPQEAELILQGNAQIQAEIQRLKTIISNPQPVIQNDATKVYEYAMALQKLSRANILTPQEKAPTYRLLANDNQHINNASDNQKIANVLTLEKQHNSPSYFHASSPENIIRILLSGNILSAHRRLYPGAFVSTRYETQFGTCVIGLKRRIEDISPLLTHINQGPFYWGAFPEHIPVWAHIEGVYIDKTRASTEDEQKVKDQVTSIKQKLDLFLQDKLTKTNDVKKKARIQKLKEDIQKVQVKDASTLTSHSDIIVPITWTSHMNAHCLIKNSQNVHEFILGSNFQVNTHKDPHGRTLAPDIFGILKAT